MSSSSTTRAIEPELERRVFLYQELISVVEVLKRMRVFGL